MSTVSSPADGLPVINERAAGIDIGSRFHVVAVPLIYPMNPYRLFRRLPPISNAWQIGLKRLVLRQLSWNLPVFIGFLFLKF